MDSVIIGLCASALTMFSFIPQIVKVAQKRSVRDVSLLMLLQLSSGVSLWVVYGALRRDAIIIVANSVTLVSLFTLLFFYFYFREKSS